MAEKLQKNGKQNGVSRLIAEPKTVVAVILVAMMALLWAKVLFRNKLGPSNAEAQSETAMQLQAGQGQRIVHIRPVKLEIVPGRNDRLTRDLFTPADWTAFAWGGENKIDKVETSQAELTERNQRHRAEQLRSNLALEAVIQDVEGKPAQAFVDGKLLETGSTFKVRREGQDFELVVREIEDNRIVLVWEKHEIELKLPEIDTGQ